MKKALLFLLVSFVCSSISAQSWIEVGGINGLKANHSINCLCHDPSGNIYACGNFTNIGGYEYVAKWNGSKWSELGGLNALGANSTIHSVCSNDLGTIYCGGIFNNSSGNLYVAKFDGTNWTELGGANSLQLAMQIGGQKLGGEITCVYCDALGYVYCCGTFVNGIAMFDGKNWKNLGGTLGLNNIVETLTGDSLGNIYAGGAFTDSLGKLYVLKWNGSQWSSLKGGVYNHKPAFNQINAIQFDPAQNIYIGGYFIDSSSVLYVAKWTGNSWVEVGTKGSFIATGSSIDRLSCDVQGNIYAAGDYFSNSYVSKWNGTSWSKLGEVFPYRALYALTINNDGNIFCAGTLQDSLNNYYVAEYNDVSTGIPVTNKPIIATVFPVPASSTITLRFENNVDATISLYDISGRLLVMEKAEGINSKQVDMQPFSSGLYLLKVTQTNGTTQTFKVIRE